MQKDHCESLSDKSFKATKEVFVLEEMWKSSYPVVLNQSGDSGEVLLFGNDLKKKID